MSTLLRVAYDGADFHGFARQAPTTGGPIRTVQGDLERALEGIYGQAVVTRGASRTDAGVHAEGQLVSFEAPLAIPPHGLAKGLNGRLPSDLAVVAAWEQEGPDGEPVDVRRGNRGKHYRYRVRCTAGRDPRMARYQWLLRRRLDPAAMEEAARAFTGTHDFGSFRASGCQAKTSERTVDEVTVGWRAVSLGPTGDRGRMDPVPVDGGTPGAGPDLIDIHVRGRAFLYNMVRIMVGSLVEVGLGRRGPEWIGELLATPDRTKAGRTAPACGLTLMEVIWPSPEHPSPSEPAAADPDAPGD